MRIAEAGGLGISSELLACNSQQKADVNVGFADGMWSLLV